MVGFIEGRVDGVDVEGDVVVALVGTEVTALEGDNEIGDEDGAPEDDKVGFKVGFKDGFDCEVVGAEDNEFEGKRVGACEEDGIIVGRTLGLNVGGIEGATASDSDGDFVGEQLGSDGCTVGLPEGIIDGEFVAIDIITQTERETIHRINVLGEAFILKCVKIKLFTSMQ